jgi:hypothetical protein
MKSNSPTQKAKEDRWTFWEIPETDACQLLVVARLGIHDGDSTTLGSKGPLGTQKQTNVSIVESKVAASEIR